LRTCGHLSDVRSGIAGFDLSPKLTLYLFGGSSEVIAEFLISVRISAFSSVRMLLVIYFLLVGVCMYSHCGDDVIDTLIDEPGD
jgi:hypothetical protein